MPPMIGTPARTIYESDASRERSQCGHEHNGDAQRDRDAGQVKWVIQCSIALCRIEPTGGESPLSEHDLLFKDFISGDDEKVISKFVAHLMPKTTQCGVD
jgi:hypothetical protein